MGGRPRGHGAKWAPRLGEVGAGGCGAAAGVTPSPCNCAAEGRPGGGEGRSAQ